MRFLRKISPEWALRIGLGLMYLYSGYDLIANPQHWYGFVPKWLYQVVTQISSIEAYLRLQGAIELTIGVLFLAWFWGRWGVRIASIVTLTEMVLIMIFVGIDPITFRDIGLLGGVLALLIISFNSSIPKQSNTI